MSIMIYKLLSIFILNHVYLAVAVTAQIKLSPEGSYIAQANYDKQRILNIQITDPDTRFWRFITFEKSNIVDFTWINEKHIAYLIDPDGREKHKLAIINVISNVITEIDIPPTTTTRFAAKSNVPTTVLPLQLDITIKGVPDLYVVNLNDFKLKSVAKNPGNIILWHYNPFSSPMGLSQNERTVTIRKLIASGDGGRDDFKMIINNKNVLELATVRESIFPTNNVKGVFYYVSNDNSDTFDLYGYDGRDQSKILYKDKNYSVVQWSLDEDGNIGTVACSTETYKYIKISKKQDIFQKALNRLPSPNSYNIRFLSMDTYFTKAIISVAKYGEPESIYFYDNSKDSLVRLYSNKKKGRTYARTELVEFPSRDGTIIRGILTKPNQNDLQGNHPVIIRVHGGPWERDTVDYDSFVQLLAEEGYYVFRINYRGSIGFGNNYHVAGYKKPQLMLNDIIDGTQWLLANFGVARDKVAIIGNSFGGYFALRALEKAPDLYCCAAVLNPVCDLLSFVEKRMRENSPEAKIWIASIGDPVRDRKMLINESPAHNYRNINKPVQFFISKNDTRIDPNEAELLCGSLKERNSNTNVIFLNDSGHMTFTVKDTINYRDNILEFLRYHLKTARNTKP